MSTPKGTSKSRRRLTFAATARKVFRSLPVVGQPEAVGERPRTRGDCEDGPRPCPWFECKYHLATDVVQDRYGNREERPTRGWDWSKPSCSLDLADAGPMSLRAVASLMGLKNERVLAIERRAVSKARRYKREPDND